MIVSQLSNLVNIIKDFDLPSYISTSVMTLIPKKKDQTDQPDHIDNNKINNNKLMSHDSHTSISSMLEEHINIEKCILNTHECDEISLTISNIMDTYIEKSPLEISSPHFEDNIREYVLSNLFLNLKELYNDATILQYWLEILYVKTSNIYFANYYPRRSHINSFIRKIPNVKTIEEKIKYIETKPQPEQKTNEWYLFRHNLITASSAWKIFKSQSTINQIIVEKCKDIDVGKYNTVNTSTPMHHGNKYEDVSIMFYEHKYNTTIHDYGCIQHDNYKFIGASPDGINVDPNSDRYGRMLEIKNPTSREITGIPKEDYWIQMQLQMETCNLNECDFLETSFKEYESEEDFTKDGNFTYSNNDELKGIIIYFMQDNKPLYKYMPLYLSYSEYELWYDTIMEKYSNLTWIKNIYWRLEQYSCILVLRNKEWFKHAIVQIEKVWNIIEQEKTKGYEHRMPKKMKTRSRSNSIQNPESEKTINTNIVVNDSNTSDSTTNGCMINIDNLKEQIIYIDTGFETSNLKLDNKVETNIEDDLSVDIIRTS
jgi:putative phage-type endonuclease